MGWKDLFKSKTMKVQPDPRLRWFGKLPIYADYYSSPPDADWAVEFNDWVLKGCEVFVARAREAGQDPRLPSAACAVRMPKSQMTVFAAFQDYGGDSRGRPFPLCFYVGVPSGLWPGPGSEHALAALRVLSDLTAIRDQVIRFSDTPGRFDLVFAGREIDLEGVDGETSDATWLEGARGLAAADWFGAIQPCLQTGDAEAWFGLMAAWGDEIVKLAGEEFSPTLRFPLAMSIPLELQVAGWLRWLERRMKLSERELSLLICKDLSGGTGRLTVVARASLPEDYLLLTPLANTLPFVDDACALAGAGIGPAGVAGTERGKPGVPRLWADFVDSASAGLTS